MSKFAVKLAVLVVVSCGLAMTFSGGKVSALSCPGGLNSDTVDPNYGYNGGEAQDGFAGVIVSSAYGSGNGWYDSRVNTTLNQAKYYLQSVVPDAPYPYSYNLGGNPQNDRIFTVNSSNVPDASSTGRTDARWFGTGGATGDNLYADAGDGGYTCPGWDAIGPGRILTSFDAGGAHNHEEAGNRHALDCGEKYYATGNPNPMGRTDTRFWIGQLPNPNGEDGYWEVRISNALHGNGTYGNVSASPMNPSDSYFTVTNGATTRIRLIWHANKPKDTKVPQLEASNGTCEYVKVANNGSGVDGRNRRVYVEITGISLGRQRTNGDPSTDNTWSPGNPSDPSRPTSVAAWVGQSGSPPDGSKGIPPLGPGDTAPYKEWWFIPWGSNSIHVKVTTEDYYDNTGDGVKNPTWNPVSTQYLDNNGSWNNSDTNRDCYSGTCNIVSATGDVDGRVIANGLIHIHATLTNTSKDDLQLWGSQITGGGTAGTTTQSSGVVLDPGDTHDYYFDIPAPAAVQSYGFGFQPLYPGPAGGGQIGPNCTGVNSVNTYQQFGVSGSTTSSLSPTNENPNSASYSTTVSVASTNPSIAIPSVHVPTYSRFYKKNAPPSNAETTLDSHTGGYYPPDPPVWKGSSPYTINPNTFQAGDRYCTSLSAYSFTSGYIGPGGPDDILRPRDPVTWGPDCKKVTNEPFFKVYNSGISASNGLTDKSGNCHADGTNSGLLAGWNDNLDGYGGPPVDRGSSAQLSALALVRITGVASAQTNIANSPTALTFANTIPSDISIDRDHPSLGGHFGATPTCTSPPKAKPGGTALGNPSNFPAAGNYKRTGNLRLNGGTVNGATAIFVDGNVYLNGNITYSSTNADGSSWSTGHIPSLVIVATGNIYIDPNVTRLDGVYEAQQKTDGSAGYIYTCATAVSNNIFKANSDFTGCHNQLMVTGSFKAAKVKLLRTFGTLRDEIPNPATAGGPLVSLTWSSCGKPGKGIDGESCPSRRTLRALRCTLVNEPSDPNGWNDNKICVPSSSTIHLYWTHCDTYAGCGQDPASIGSDPGLLHLGSVKSGKGTPSGIKYPYCVQWNVPKDPDTWTDNWLCSDQDIGMTFGSAGGPGCTKISEVSDSDANWSSGYYLCVTNNPPKPASSKAPFTDCSNAGAQVTTSTCAAEVFRFTPELYLTDPDTELPSRGATQYDSYTSLPPVL